MMDWKRVLATVAPALATLAGGPLAGNIVREIGEKWLGKTDATEQDIAQAITTLPPAELVKLKEIEAGILKTMQDAGIRIEEIDAADRDSARRRAVDMRDFTPNGLAFLLLALFAYVLHALMAGQDIGQDGQIAMMMIGGLIAANQQALNYFFGTTRASAEKTKTLAGLAAK